MACSKRKGQAIHIKVKCIGFMSKMGVFMQKRIALLIDAENTSVKYISTIIEEVKRYGDVTFQRIYGDFSNSKMTEWNKKALEYAIVPIHQSIYTTGKNAADIMLVIDAMDIMFQNNVDGFCLVSSDSDFTRLANRLRESGKLVIGMGLSNASKTFVSACNEYKFLDRILDAENGRENDSDKSAITPIGEIKTAINRIVQQAENKGEYANLGSTKSDIQRQFPDFDERNYGYTLFRKFIEEETKFELLQKTSTVYIVRKNHVVDERVILDYIRKCAEKKVDLGKLGQELHELYPEFKYKELGYSTLSKYISNIDGIVIENGAANKKYVTKLRKGNE